MKLNLDNNIEFYHHAGEYYITLLFLALLSVLRMNRPIVTVYDRYNLSDVNTAIENAVWPLNLRSKESMKCDYMMKNIVHMYTQINKHLRLTEQYIKYMEDKINYVDCLK